MEALFSTSFRSNGQPLECIQLYTNVYSRTIYRFVPKLNNNKFRRRVSGVSGVSQQWTRSIKKKKASAAGRRLRGSVLAPGGPGSVLPGVAKDDVS
jgi:hypothetical protein